MRLVFTSFSASPSPSQSLLGEMSAHVTQISSFPTQCSEGLKRGSHAMPPSDTSQILLSLVRKHVQLYCILRNIHAMTPLWRFHSSGGFTVHSYWLVLLFHHPHFSMFSFSGSTVAWPWSVKWNYTKLGVSTQYYTTYQMLCSSHCHAWQLTSHLPIFSVLSAVGTQCTA